MTEFCPVCLSKGKRTALKCLQMNLSEAAVMCGDITCPYPFGVSSTDTFIKVDFMNLVKDETSGCDNSSVPSDNVNADQGGDTETLDENYTDLLEMLKFDDQNSNNSSDLNVDVDFANILAILNSDAHSSRSDSGQVSADVSSDIYNLENDFTHLTVDSVSRVNSSSVPPALEADTDGGKCVYAEEAASAGQSTTVQVHEGAASSVQSSELTGKPLAEAVCGSDTKTVELQTENNIMLEHNYFKEYRFDTDTRIKTEQLTNIDSSPALATNCAEFVGETQAESCVATDAERKQSIKDNSRVNTKFRKCRKKGKRKVLRKVKVNKQEDISKMSPDELHFDVCPNEESSNKTAKKSPVSVKQESQLVSGPQVAIKTQKQDLTTCSVKCEPSNEAVDARGSDKLVDLRSIKPSINLSLLTGKKFAGFSFVAAAEAAILEINSKVTPRPKKRVVPQSIKNLTLSMLKNNVDGVSMLSRPSASRPIKNVMTPSTCKDNVDVGSLSQVSAQETARNETTSQNTDDWIKDLLS